MRCKQPIILKDNIEQVIKVGVDPKMSGIYLWEIENIGRYVGKYKNPNRPLDEYNNNVRKICCGLPYRKSKPNQFRRIHHALHDALHGNKKIKLSYLENVSLELLNERERYWIEELKTELNG